MNKMIIFFGIIGSLMIIFPPFITVVVVGATIFLIILIIRWFQIGGRKND